ncbi:hypothetical protein AB0B15_00440 [Streptomyces sp. NPDC045456]|uniref:hypothetical protein n=1 Tax=Streptomyces sp. NPDC045456 TaxID=3155254 RepID=UPI003400A410
MLERAKIIDVSHGSTAFQELRRTVLSMDVPDGYRAGIIGGKTVMSPCRFSRAGAMLRARSLRPPQEGPGENGYAKGDTVEFGDPLHIPAPFDCQLDTTDFVVALLDDEEEQGTHGAPHTPRNRNTASTRR